MKNTHIGIIGGGQLGLLLIQSAISFPVSVAVYDPNPECSAAGFAHEFVQGNFDDKEGLINFCKKCDVIIYENERINIEALKEVKAMGIGIVSDFEDLEWIQDKFVQRKKLQEADLPGPNFEEVMASEVRSYNGSLPVVQKFKTGGYDGMGVVIHKNEDSIKKAPEVDSVFEEMIDIKSELSVIIARSRKTKETVVYDAVELISNPEINLLDYLVSPARIDQSILDKAKEIGHQIAEKFDFNGIYAIELFLDQNDKILVNEISPRTHNSGHHTISTHVTSQYEQQIRVALGLPLGSIEEISPCVFVNLLADDSTGETTYKGLEEAYEISNVQYTFYGKKQVRPHRKMGHAVILEKNVEDAINKIDKIRNTLTITSHD